MHSTDFYPLPDWVQWEIDNPAEEGGRNNQCYKIGHMILRCGRTVEELERIFEEMHPDFEDIEALVAQSAKRALVALKPPDPVAVARRNLIFREAREALPGIIRVPRAVPRTIGLQLGEQRRAFLLRMFRKDDVIWIGEKTGKNFLLRDQWIGTPRRPFTCGSTFKPDSTSRSNANVAVRRYMVVESDELKPGEVMAVFGHLQERHHLALRAIVSTGGKSLHGWFDWPGGDQADWQAMIKGYRCDPATLRPSQPVRCPGVIRPDTGRPQELLFCGGLVSGNVSD